MHKEKASLNGQQVSAPAIQPVGSEAGFNSGLNSILFVIQWLIEGPFVAKRLFTKPAAAMTERSDGVRSTKELVEQGR